MSQEFRQGKIPSKVHGGCYRVNTQFRDPDFGIMTASVTEESDGSLHFQWRQEGRTFILFRGSMSPEQAKLCLVRPKPERSYRPDPNVGKLIDVVEREQALRAKELDLRAKELDIKEQLNKLEAARLQLEYMQRQGNHNAPRIR